MRVAALIPLVGCVWNLLLAFFVLSRAPRASQNRVYFFIGLFISIWNFGQFYNFTTPETDPISADFWVRFVWFGVLFIPMLLFHLSMLHTQTSVGKMLPVGYGLLFLLALTLPTPFFLTGVRHLGTAGWYAIPGPGLHLANLPFALMFVAIFILVRKRRTIPKIQRSKLTALVIAQTMLAILGTNDTLPLNGFDNYPLTSVPVYPYGSIAAVFYGVIVAYSVLQHELLDVQISLSRIAAQVVRMTFLTIITLALLLLATLIFPHALTPASLWLALGVFTISTIVATLAFPRLFGDKGMETLERRILGDRFEYQDRVRAFIDNMVWYHDLQELLDDLHRMLTMTFRLTGYQVVLRDDTNRVFSLVRAHPEEPQRQLPELSTSASAFQYFEWEKAEYLFLQKDRPTVRPPSALEKLARNQFKGLSGEVCFPLSWESESFGLLLVGKKTSGDPFTRTDIGLLVSLVKNMSLMVNQLRLKNQLLQNQELDLLGKMSRGMAHDLNNLLTPVWTLFQLATENGNTEPLDDELLPVALRNVKIMSSYIKEALFFSENLRPDFQLGRLDVLVIQAVELARASRKKAVQVVLAVQGTVLAEMDEVLLQRMIANIISNAIDASVPDGLIRVELEVLARTEKERDWLRIRIIDHGEGIRKEDLNRIFTPYYTTKTHGDEARGFGLGLAICRKIVNLHGGNLSIQSQHKRGTTVQIDLPSLQARPQSAPLVTTH